MKTIGIICAAMFVFCVMLLIKNEVTFRQHMRIADAIHEYNINALENGCHWEETISFLTIQPYEKTLWRLWYWGYKNLVPKEIYEKIKPFIR